MVSGHTFPLRFPKVVEYQYQSISRYIERNDPHYPDIYGEKWSTPRLTARKEAEALHYPTARKDAEELQDLAARKEIEELRVFTARKEAEVQPAANESAANLPKDLEDDRPVLQKDDDEPVNDNPLPGSPTTPLD
ncbi:hypothetical protein NHQ30_001984 [Ciborinia camelliae]|nr:hypothetical protein NHQ30_001984 [Ciborinia camelliae]